MFAYMLGNVLLEGVQMHAVRALDDSSHRAFDNEARLLKTDYEGASVRRYCTSQPCVSSAHLCSLQAGRLHVSLQFCESKPVLDACGMARIIK
jgi:hypothetical protein